MCVCLYVCVGVCCFRVLMYLCIHVHVCIRWMWCRGLFHRARICKWILQVWMFWSRYQLSSSSPPVACSVAYLQQVFFFHPLQWNSRICVCLCACVCVCVHVCVWPTTVCEPYKANQETFKDKKRCESLFSLICSEARKHPLLCPQWLPWGDIYILCECVCVCVCPVVLRVTILLLMRCRAIHTVHFPRRCEEHRGNRSEERRVGKVWGGGGGGTVLEV